MSVVLNLIKSLGNVSGMGVEVADAIKAIETILGDIQTVEAGKRIDQTVGVVTIQGHNYEYGVFAQRV